MGRKKGQLDGCDEQWKAAGIHGNSRGENPDNWWQHESGYGNRVRSPLVVALSCFAVAAAACCSLLLQLSFNDTAVDDDYNEDYDGDEDEHHDDDGRLSRR